MERARSILRKLLHPPVWVEMIVPIVSFAALIAVFVSRCEKNALTYLIYGMSAYSLAIWLAALPGVITWMTSAIGRNQVVRRVASAPVTRRYFSDPAFRGSVSIYQGAAVNFFYVVFRIVVGIRYASVWFISMAAYYLVLGGLRLSLIRCYRCRTPETERRCYRRTAWLLFLLNIPMGGMIVQMVLTNSGYSYPGYLIYLSALYTFCSMTTAVRNLVKFRRLGSPVLSAAKVLNFVSAMMSVLGLQTAMISRFSANGEGYRRMMNAVTGGVVYGVVILLAVYMLLRSRKIGREKRRVSATSEK